MADESAPTLTLAGLTDVGRVRQRNEDSFALIPDQGLAVVCDGMGGHAGGDLASRMAAEAISDFIAEFGGSPSGVTGDAGLMARTRNAMSVVCSAVTMANRRIFALNRERGYGEGRGMGTTVAGFWHLTGSGRVVVFHAGDSRLYRLRDGVAKPVTRDHSLYQLWLDNGRRGAMPPRNVILRALGTALDLEPETALVSARAGDVFLLCTDGLNGMVPDEAIGAVLSTAPSAGPAAACRALVDQANEAGGHDNVTAVIGCFGAGG